MTAPRDILRLLLALAALAVLAACGPRLPDDIDVLPPPDDDASYDPDAEKPPTLTDGRTCSNAGRICGANGDCCRFLCDFTTHQCR